MFCPVMDVFDETRRKWVWLSEKPHATGTLKNYCFPMARPMTVLESELPALEFKYLLYGHGGRETTGEPLAPKVMGNVAVTPGLAEALAGLSAACHGSAELSDQVRAEELLAALDSAKAVFANTPRAEPVSATAACRAEETRSAPLSDASTTSTGR
jgi:hypothetical protein